MPKTKIAIDLLNQLEDAPSDNITAHMIKRLRDITNGELSLAECKHALTESKGNILNAVQLLVERDEVALYKRQAERNIYDRIQLKEPYQLSQLIEVIANEAYEFEYSDRHSFMDTGFDLYADKDHDVDVWYADLVCYAVDGLTVNDKGEEVYPDFVTEKGLVFISSGEMFEDVIYAAVYHKGLKNSRPTMEEYISALNYYRQNDSYLLFD